MKVERIMTNRIKRTKTKAKGLPNPPIALIVFTPFKQDLYIIFFYFANAWVNAASKSLIFSK
jgi:hypothetical protein